MKRKDFLKFAFITDTHIDNKYGNRIDNTIDSILSKIKQSYEIAEKEKCEFIIHGGDVFNRVSIKEKKEEVFLRLRHIITSSKLKTYFIFGQHDINYSKETYNNSSLKLLAGSCDGKMQLIDGKIEFDNCIIYSSHVYDDIEKIVYNILPCNKPTIVIAHCLLYDKKSFFDTIDVARIALKSKNVNLILSGDLHCGFPFQKHENTWFYNPGSLLRKSIDQKDRKPKLAIITINPFFDDWDIGLKEVELNCLSGELCFSDKSENIKVKELSEKDNLDITEFAQELCKFETKNIDVFDFLINAGKNKGIKESIIQRIYDYKNKINFEE